MKNSTEHITHPLDVRSVGVYVHKRIEEGEYGINGEIHGITL